MDLFNKNPFANKSVNPNTKIVGNNVQFDEKKKLENIRENMADLKLKGLKPNSEIQQKQEIKQTNLQERIETLRNLSK